MKNGESSLHVRTHSSCDISSAISKLLDKKGFGKKKTRARSSSLPPENKIHFVYKSGTTVISCRNIFRNNSSGHVDVNDVLDKKPTKVYTRPDRNLYSPRMLPAGK